MLGRFVMVLAALGAAACNNLTTAPTPVASASQPLPPPPLPTTVPGVLSLRMPIDAADAVTTAFGMLPFGYHGGGHTEDGHAGWDIEYRPGAQVRAAAGGTVIAIDPDPDTPGRSIVVLEHVVGEHFYRTHYTNLASVASTVTLDATLLPGQAIGAAGTITETIGDASVSYAMTHFQLDDLEYHREISNPKAVSPEPFLNADGKALFDRIWTSAVYLFELVEPFATTDRERAVTVRTWTRAGGDGPAGIRFTRSGVRYDYELLTESGTVVEAGAVILRSTARPPALDLVSPTATRLGAYDILSNEMRLTLANPGESRPASASASNVYRTAR
jgi:hypothetical protein